MTMKALLLAGVVAVGTAGRAQAAETKFGGLIFGEHKYTLSKRDNTGVNSTVAPEAGSYSQGRSQFSITRVYVNAEAKFTNRVKGKVVLEGNSTSPNTVFVKNAFGEYAFAEYAKFQAGMVGMPWISFEEGIWGRRFVQKVQADQEGILNSADLGIGLNGDIPKGFGSYAMTYTNGEGYKTDEKTQGDGRSKNFAARLSLIPLPMPLGGLEDLLAGFKVHGFVSVDNQLLSRPYNDGVGYSQAWRRDRYLLAASYQHKLFHLMYSYLWVTQGDGWLNRKANGWSLHGSAKLPYDFSVFARYDRFSKPNDWLSLAALPTTSPPANAAAGQNEVGAYRYDSSTYYRGVVGVDYKLTEGVRLSINDQWLQPVKPMTFGRANLAAGAAGLAANTNGATTTNVSNENILYTQFEMKF
ncbi:MAG: hypothetical protein HY927_00780 [Elusimicrobia bacterium]|nr:hypothetical protein [Elusimicrobiota bacterium]